MYTRNKTASGNLAFHAAEKAARKAATSNKTASGNLAFHRSQRY